ncbi:hypothetical protein DYB25_003917 [Aphanomyces astaci]|uniref:Uncharacterized protein n=1 Tax=Aphanomyces astaci TaxID=112090 RepID=A0A397AH51_APHAT|nr:hypothetical protein DYB25_003917 [Aphanomyces astaci]
MEGAAAGHDDDVRIGHGVSSHLLHAVLGIGPTAPMGGDPLQINPPNLEDYSSDDEENVEQADQMHPLSRDELKLKTLKGLRRGSSSKSPTPSSKFNAAATTHSPAKKKG